MMRIGIMCHGSCGGSSRVAVDLASELAMQGHYVHLISNVPVFFQPLPNERLFKYCPDENALEKKDPSLLALDWPAERIEAMTDFVVDLITEQKLDVLHIHYAIPLALVAARVKKRLALAAQRLLPPFTARTSASTP